MTNKYLEKIASKLPGPIKKKVLAEIGLKTKALKHRIKFNDPPHYQSDAQSLKNSARTYQNASDKARGRYNAWKDDPHWGKDSEKDRARALVARVMSSRAKIMAKTK